MQCKMDQPGSVLFPRFVRFCPELVGINKRMTAAMTSSLGSRKPQKIDYTGSLDEVFGYLPARRHRAHDPSRQGPHRCQNQAQGARGEPQSPQGTEAQVSAAPRRVSSTRPGESHANPMTMSPAGG